MTMLMNSSYALMPNHLGVWDDDRGGLYRSSHNWAPRGRGAGGMAAGRIAPYFELWRGPHMSDDNAVCLGNSEDTTIWWEDEQYGDGGTARYYYLKGQVVDSNGTAQTGVRVMAFRTSDNLYVGEAYSNSAGNYVLPTPYSGVSHFIVAYLDTATDLVGTTVNNLTPTAT